jgi:uncharacterized membrane protein YagU involved in acid resistance
MSSGPRLLKCKVAAARMQSRHHFSHKTFYSSSTPSFVCQRPCSFVYTKYKIPYFSWPRHLFSASSNLTLSILQPCHMALPVVHTLTECADFTQTVSPYIYQLYDLPQQLLQSYSNTTELRNLYLSTNPLISGFAFSILLAAIFLVVSEVNRNYSQVDRCWSILPTLYNAHFTIYAHMSGLPIQRLDNLLAFSVVWSVRSLHCQVYHIL